MATLKTKRRSRRTKRAKGPCSSTRRQPGTWLGEVVMYCEGSMQTPVIRQSKPHCPKCGKMFHWYELVDRLQGVPEH